MQPGSLATRSGFEPLGKHCCKSVFRGTPGNTVEILDRIRLPREVPGHSMAEPQGSFCKTLVECTSPVL